MSAWFRNRLICLRVSHTRTSCSCAPKCLRGCKHFFLLLLKVPFLFVGFPYSSRRTLTTSPPSVSLLSIKCGSLGVSQTYGPELQAFSFISFYRLTHRRLPYCPIAPVFCIQPGAGLIANVKLKLECVWSLSVSSRPQFFFCLFWIPFLFASCSNTLSK
jgi:hypothetical protein